MTDCIFYYHWKFNDVLLLLMWKKAHMILHTSCIQWTGHFQGHIHRSYKCQTFVFLCFCFSLSCIPFGFHSCTNTENVTQGCHSSWLAYPMTLIWFWQDQSTHRVKWFIPHTHQNHLFSDPDLHISLHIYHISLWLTNVSPSLLTLFFHTFTSSLFHSPLSWLLFLVYSSW